MDKHTNIFDCVNDRCFKCMKYVEIDESKLGFYESVDIDIEKS